MGQVARQLLYVLNILYAICGAATAAFGAWFFVQLYEIMVLRNVNHYYLNYDIYWVQVIPWVYVVLGLSLMAAAWCGCSAVSGNRRATLVLYMAVLATVAAGFVLATALVLVFADGHNTDKFVDDTVLDAFHNARTDAEVRAGFDRLEMKYQCCGAMTPRDYTTTSRQFSAACCHDQALAAGATCDLVNTNANNRYGCSQVVRTQARRVLVWVAAGCVLLALALLAGVVAAVRLYRQHHRHHRRPPGTPQLQDCESKKVLL